MLLLSVFADVVAPVFAVVALGYLAGPRLGLKARTLSRAAYWIFVPAFTFGVIAGARVEPARAGRIGLFVLVSHALFAALGLLAARLLGRSRDVTAAYVMLAVFGNIGNFGLALLRFRLGDEALVPATLYFVASLLLSFAASVAAAAWARGEGLGALGSVLRTPAILAAIPALALSALDLRLPLPVARTAELLGSAMIPVMLFVLGLQLSGRGALRLGGDVVVATCLRLVVSPAVAALLVGPLGLAGVDRATCILQAAMPAAVLVAIISAEHEVAPAFVTATVFYSTVLSLPVLTLLLALL